MVLLKSTKPYEFMLNFSGVHDCVLKSTKLFAVEVLIMATVSLTYCSKAVCMNSCPKSLSQFASVSLGCSYPQQNRVVSKCWAIILVVRYQVGSAGLESRTD